MNKHQWIIFGVGFLVISYFSFFVIPEKLGLVGVGSISDFIILSLISGILGFVFIISGLFEEK